MENKNRRPWMQILVMVVSIVVAVAIIVFAALQIAGVLENAVNFVVPLLGVSNLCQAYMHWEKNRKVAYFHLGTAILIFICSIVLFFIK